MTQTPADWYPDPYGRHELRYWDGELWTDNVASHGRQGIDKVTDAGVKTVVGTHRSDKVATQVARADQQAVKRGAPTTSGSVVEGTGLFDRKTIVVNQKRKLIEVNSEYAIYDQQGTQIGAVRQVGQSTAKKVVRFLGSLDQFFTHKLQVVDAQNNVLMGLTRPAKFIKSKIIVSDGTGNTIGMIRQENVFFKIRFAIEVGGQKIGGINAENWRAWNFRITDAHDNEVARITKTFEGVLTTLFTTADNYVVQIHQDLPDPMRQMVFAAALGVDTALKQDHRGFSPLDLLGN